MAYKEIIDSTVAHARNALNNTEDMDKEADLIKRHGNARICATANIPN